MLYFSTNKSSVPVSLKKATLEGLAPDGGLYVPAELPFFSPEELAFLEGADFTSVALAITKKFTGSDIPVDRLSDIIDSCYDFETPIVSLDSSTFVAELFCGPTLAFKDYGARFLARLTGYFATEEQRMTTVLVATSGDTGSAVAYGFDGIENTRVVLLYPSGKVSPLQECQLTTAGNNVHALEVQGDFDDCQRMVKEAFGDPSLQGRLRLTSANSINISRLIPQTFYYAWAALQLQERHGISNAPFSVPSGNYGNVTAGILAKKMGFPIGHFIAASNANDSVTRYLATGRYDPVPTVATLSTAMDVGNPSNFARLRYFYKNDHQLMNSEMSGTSVSDDETRQTMRSVYERFGYVMEPHTAVAFCALERYRNNIAEPGHPGIMLSTAHPVKFQEAITETLGITPAIPENLALLMKKEKKATLIKAEYRELATFLNGLA